MAMREGLGRRWVVLPFAAVLGLICAGLALLNDDPAMAVFAFALLTGFGAVLAFSRSEWAVSQSGEADERQRALNDEATRYAYFAVVTVAVIGLFFEIARGTPGPFTIVCAVGGFTHMIALAVLRARR